MLVSTGFADRIYRTHTLPLCMWSLDRCQHLIGERMLGLLAWRTPEADTDGFVDGLALELLTRWLGWKPEAVRELTSRCEWFVQQPENRIYVNLHTFTARKPYVFSLVEDIFCFEHQLIELGVEQRPAIPSSWKLVPEI